MHTSENGIKLIKEFEGCRLQAYTDPAGVWTIGYGHTGNVPPTGLITKEEAEELLISDLHAVEKHVNALPYDLTQGQYDALVSFTFNCGAGNLKKLTKNNMRTLAEIGEKMLLYVNAGGTQLAGLVRRRKAERELFLSGDSDYFPAYSGTSPRIDEVFETIGATEYYDFSKPKPYLRRKPIAGANGYVAYTGSFAQNIDLIALAKKGELKKP